MLINPYKLSAQDKTKQFIIDIREKLFNYSQYKYKKLFWNIIEDIRKNHFSSGSINYLWQGYLENVQIETINRCNGECAFCPVNKHVDSRKFTKMTDTLYKKIIYELSKQNYSGSVALFSNNEPLLDKRLPEFARIAREKLPTAYLYIYTNGTMLNLEVCKELSQYLNRIVVDCYSDDLSIPKNILEIENICEGDPVLNDIVHIRLRKVHEVLSSRGGQAPNKLQCNTRSLPCLMPFQQLIIRPDGKVSLCCNDALGKMTLGDLNQKSIQDIWESDSFARIREMVTLCPEKMELCQFCDSLLHHDLTW